MASKYIVAALWLVGALVPLWEHYQIGLADLALRDFASLWVAGKMVLTGQVADIYILEALRSFGRALLGSATAFNFTYPPHALFLITPFALLPLPAAFIAWNILSAAFFYWAARPHLPTGLPPILAILTPAALFNAEFGQFGFVAGGLWLLAFRGSGIAAALLTAKPHIGFLLLFRMVKDRRALWVAIGGTLALATASAVIFGVSAWPAFLSHATQFQAGSLIGDSYNVWVLAGVTPAIGYGMLGWVPFALAGALLLYRNFNVFTAATATFLISPYGFLYDMTVVCLGFGLLVFSRWEEMPPLHRALACLAFVSPELVRFGTWWVPPIILAGLWVQSKYRLESELRKDHQSLAAAGETKVSV